MSVRAHWLDHRIPPPLVAVVVAIGMWAVSAWGPRLSMPAPASHMTALLLAAAGLAIDAAALATFRLSRTTFNPLKPHGASTLVTRGPYRFSRNPMYVGSGFLLLAWAVYLDALLALAGVVVFVLYITRFQIRPEERVLAALFGEQYTSYAARVRRWL
jgi:protein-S-isoprenylcysteine O-methyltransferase Ste14